MSAIHALYTTAAVDPAASKHFSATFRRSQSGTPIAHPTAGARNTAFVLVSIASANSSPIPTEPITGRFILGSRTAAFNIARVNVVSSGSRIASRLKQ